MRSSRLVTTPRRSGFTLIELMVVVTIIGILAAMAVVGYKSTRGRAFAASMRADLHNLAASEEGHYYQYGYYTTDLVRLGVEPSPGVTLTITGADSSGWGAVALHPAVLPTTCAMFSGATPSPAPPATVEGLITCQ